MTPVNWDSNRDLMQNDMGRLFERFFGGVEGGARPWMPPMDLLEEDDHFIVHADLPGMGEDDLTVEVEDRMLRISGERRPPHDPRNDGWRRVERSFGRFERTLLLPEGVDTDGISADFDRGVLKLRIPKPVQSTPKRIRIGNQQSEVEGSESKRELSNS